MHRGDRIIKRGLGFTGTVLDSKDGWTTVKWDAGRAPKLRPLYCSDREIELAVGGPS